MGSGSRFALAVLSSVLLAVPVHREGAWPLGGVFLIPLLAATSGARAIEAAALGAFAGVLYGIAISLWIPDALRVLGSSRFASLAGLVLVSLWAAPPGFGLLGLASRATARWAAGPRALAAIVFAVETWIGRAWWGVPWGWLGASQRGAIGVAQLPVLGGVPLISALLVGLNTALAELRHKPTRAARPAAALGASWLALVLAGLPVAEAMRCSRFICTACAPSPTARSRASRPASRCRPRCRTRLTIAAPSFGAVSWAAPSGRPGSTPNAGSRRRARAARSRRRP